MSASKIVLVSCALLGLISCNRGRYELFSGYAQGGVYSIKADLSGVSVSKDEIAAAIDSLLTEIDFSVSGYNKASLLSRFNAGEDVTPDRHFSALIGLSERYSAATGGALDVWGGPLFDLWGFGFKTGDFPTEAEVSAARSLVSEHKSLNFNAIAQGYSCDVIAAYLHSLGVVNMLVDIGEIYCEGVNPKGLGWTIAIDNPVDGNNTPGADINGIWTSDGGAHGIVTSGNYRKFYIKNGRKYAHTIDTRSGYPVEHNLLSATIIAPTSAEADAIATACMVIGLDAAKELIMDSPELEAYLIYDGGVWRSEGF